MIDRLAPQLAAVVALAEQDGHMTRAADSLGIPQSSMSRRVHALEKSLGVPLLIHEGRVVRLTEAGTDLARQTRGPLRQLAAIIETIMGDSDPDSGTVRFGFPLTMGSGRIPDLLTGFRHRHPGIRVLLKQAHGAELTADLLSGSLDLAVMIPAPESLPHTVIGTQRIHAVLPRGHRLGKARGVRLPDLAGETFIANPPSYNLRQVTEKWCREAGFEPNIAVEVTEFATIRELIDRGLGVGLLPHDDRTPEGADERPLLGARHQRDIALVSGTLHQSPATRRLSEYLRAGFS